MNKFKLGQKVKVTMGDWVFESEILDTVNHHRKRGIWVDHPQLRGEDMLFVDFEKDSAEVIEEIKKEENQSIREIRKEVENCTKYLDGDVSVQVKVFDHTDNNPYLGTTQTYDVEINVYNDGEYEDGWVNQTFHGRFIEDSEALGEARKRANAVLRSVKGWFKYSDVEVENGVEIYS